METKKLLCLDLASHTGWASYNDGKLISSGIQDFSKRRGESNGILFLRFRKWFLEMVAIDRPDLIVYERAHHRGGAATEICVGLQTHAQSLAEEKGIQSVPIHTATLKAFANKQYEVKARDKTNVMAYATKLLGRPPLDDNEADAVVMGVYATEEYVPPTE